MPHPTEQRAARRDFFSVTFDYTYRQGVNGGAVERTVKAVSTNLSDVGLGFITDRPLLNGQPLTLTLGDRGRVGAEVRWCRRLSDHLYRLGVAFTGARPLAA